jgi:hypothetical protein
MIQMKAIGRGRCGTGRPNVFVSEPRASAARARRATRADTLCYRIASSERPNSLGMSSQQLQIGRLLCTLNLALTRLGLEDGWQFWC